MKDRQPSNPGRIRIIPEDGSPAFFATIEMADNPTVEGTPLNKANLLSDSTAKEILPGTLDPTPDQALKAVHDKATSADSKAQAAQNTANSAQSKANAAMPKSGGTFTGHCMAPKYVPVDGYAMRNTWVGTDGSHTVPSAYIWFKV